MSNYLYQRRGGPLVKWTGSAPLQSRAADAVSLGDCACHKDDSNADKIPRPGAPEFIGDYVATGDGAAVSAIDKVDDAVHSGAGRSVAMAANAWHGYRRNGSIGWALGWAILGYAAPVITTVIATAQGFGHKKGS